MLNSQACFQKRVVILLYCFLLTSTSTHSTALADEKETGSSHPVINKLESLFDGFTLGPQERIFPYASLEDWFDPYGGLKLEHRAFLNSEDRFTHHFKFETPRDYSWKIRYLANSLSTEKTKFSFLFKIKFDQDAFFYGIGNSTSKLERDPATYASVFFGSEVRQRISQKWVFSWSPGYWHVRSGLKTGGEFEKPASAKFMTSRFAFGGIKPVNYRSTAIENQWTSYAELGIPLTSSISTYLRLNFQTNTRIPVYRSSKLGVETRMEYLVSTDRDLVPYFAVSEVGSRTGLRGFSKERFRNFGISVVSVEYSVPISNDFEAFLLTDFAQTASNLKDYITNNIHLDYGFGLRLISLKHPISFGIANSREDLKLFSNINIIF